MPRPTSQPPYPKNDSYLLVIHLARYVAWVLIARTLADGATSNVPWSMLGSWFRHFGV